MWYYNYPDYLSHHGIKGQKWGIRRYQNEDGSLTEAGKKRYDVGEARKAYKQAKKEYKQASKYFKRRVFAATSVSKMKQDEAALANIDKKRMDMMDARVNLRATKRGGTEKAYKNAYARELYKYGLPGSAMDTANRNIGSKYLNDISKKKGEAYANDVLKKNRNRLIASAAVSAAVIVGAEIASAFIDD